MKPWRGGWRLDLLRKSYRVLAVERLLRGFLGGLKRKPYASQLNQKDGFAYFWNEREFQWALVSYMRRYANACGLGSARWIRAEGSVAIPRWSRWKGPRRSDVVVIDHTAYRRFLERGDDEEFPQLESMIELKVVWPGQGRAFHQDGFEGDVDKLNRCLKDELSKSAYFLILDNLDRGRVPYFSTRNLRELKSGTKVTVYHWPDGDTPVDDPRWSRIGVY